MSTLTARTRATAAAMFSGQAVVEVLGRLEKECGATVALVSSPQHLERIRLAVLKVSAGSMEEFDAAVALAQQDWRDLLMNAGFGQLEAHEVWARSILLKG